MILAYTDGSSRGNPGPGGWAAVVHAGDKVVELGGREDHTTNNQMELMGAIKAVEWMAVNGAAGPATMKCDSKYVIQGITSWVKGWKRNGWKTAGKKDVGNRELWETLDAAVRATEKAGIVLSWEHVDGHVGIAGNERCDEIATSFADGENPDLYDGAFGAYSIDLHFKDETSPAAEGVAKKKASKSRKTGPAYSYLSLVDGELQKHVTWAECEARVKGKRAKFKKAMNAAEESDIMREWTEAAGR